MLWNRRSKICPNTVFFSMHWAKEPAKALRPINNKTKNSQDLQWKDKSILPTNTNNNKSLNKANSYGMTVRTKRGHWESTTAKVYLRNWDCQKRSTRKNIRENWRTSTKRNINSKTGPKSAMGSNNWILKITLTRRKIISLKAKRRTSIAPLSTSEGPLKNTSLLSQAWIGTAAYFSLADLIKSSKYSKSMIVKIILILKSNWKRTSCLISSQLQVVTTIEDKSIVGLSEKT